MSAAMPHALPDASRPRSLFVTVFAWAVIGLAALLTPISLISLLMILAGGQGTSTDDPIGFLTVVVGPPAFVATGIGLLLRKKWAWHVMVAALTTLILSNFVDLFRDHSVKERTYTSPSGVLTTEFSGGTPVYAVPVLVVCLPLLAMLFLKRVRAEFNGGDGP